jgi:hypothetical protein
MLSLWCGSAVAATVLAVADRDRIGAGESLQLQLRVDGSPDGEPDLSPLEKDWEILNRSQSSQMQIVNGSFSRTVVYSLSLMPKTSGSLVIPAICFAKDCTLPLPIEVAKTPVTTGAGEETLLLEAEVSPQKIVTQGQLLFTVRLLRRVDLLEGQLNEPQPTGVSAVVKKLGDDRSYETRRKGRLYQVIERSYAIFPQGVGEMLIPPLQFDGSIAGRRSRLDPFGQQGQRVRRTSQPLAVEVTPLPADIGRRPWIPAISVELQDDWQQQPPKLTVGEPATRTLHLGASGVLAAQLPELKPGVPAGFKTYPDQPKREELQSPTGITSVLEQKIALIPTRAGHFTLPAVDLDWWDVNQRRWQSVHLAALELEVAPEPDSLPGKPSAGASEAASQSAAGVPLPAGLAPVESDDAPSVQPAAGFWPWLSLGLALGWLLSLFLLWRLRRLDKSQAVPQTPDLKPSEKQARKAVIQAANAMDPQRTRRALLLWSGLLYPETVGSSYERLCHTADPVLRAELEALDLCLYGLGQGDWDGRQLAEAIAAWQAAPTTVSAGRLPDLYP